MKIKLDENLPEALVHELNALGHDVDNVRMESLSGSSEVTRMFGVLRNRRLDF